MAVDVERLVVQLSADVKKYENALNRAMGQTNKQARGIERRFQQMNRNITSGFSGLGMGLTKALTVAGGVRGFQSLLDSATKIDNALKVAGLSGEELEKVYGRLRDSAVKNAAPLEAMVTLYGRIAQAQDALNVSGDEVTDFVDKIGVALRVSGASATEASGALLQLSQALGSGIVRAEEYNSINEGARPILQAVAAGLKETGGDVAKLRNLVMDGKVSSEAFFRAFEAGAVILEEKVAGATLTTEQGLTNINTALVDAMREFAKGSLAAESLGEAFGVMADKINQIDFKQFGEQVRELVGMIEQIREALGWLQGLGIKIGSTLGTDAIGDWATGGAAHQSFLGGAFTITNQRGVQDRITQAFGHAVDTAAGLTEDAVRQAAREVVADGKSGRLGGEVIPVSLSNYDIPGSKDKKGGKSAKERADDYERLAARIADSTSALIAETEVQRQLNPLIDDYGYAVERARAEQDLLNAALKAGKEITPELRAQIGALADQYALATVEAAKLAEGQDKIRERAEEMRDLQKEVTRGIIDGFIEGRDAAEIFADALKKVGDHLINDVLDSIFQIKNASSGGGIFGFLGSLFGMGGGISPLASSFISGGGVGLFSDGGYTGPGGKYQPAGIVHRGEYVVPKNIVDKVGPQNIQRLFAGYANGGLVGAPKLPSLASSVARSGPQNVNINIDVTGAKGNTEIEAMVQSGVRAGLREYDRGSDARFVNGLQNARKRNLI
jgi:tape measure domain-containing protein